MKKSLARLAVLVTAGVAVVGMGAPSAFAAEGATPNGRGSLAMWTTGAKQGVGAPMETPSTVADRYAKGTLVAGPALSIDIADNSTTDADTITITGTTDAASVWVNVNGSTTAASVTGGRYTVTVPAQRGENKITVAATGATGGISIARRTVTSTNFGTLVGSIRDAAGDDNGPGTYVYPTNDAFVDGAFDIDKFDVYEDGEYVNLVTTIAGDITNPWGGDELSTQRIDIYIDGNGTDGQPFNAHQGTNAQLVQPYSVTVGGSGFAKPSVVDRRENHLGFGELLVVPKTHQIAFTVPRVALAGIDLGAAGYQVVMTSHAANDEGVGNIRPVYSKSYWDNATGTDHAWVQEYRFGGGAGADTTGTTARDTDTRDPNALDILVPPGQSQQDLLHWEVTSPVILPYVALN
ncbi:glucodextranase DOMON-like domain-containing protein [Micromonospora sp. DT81.3]|uniref:glucodextranase DOMON-like domain-containing protein n=1 Tax=Micromonospora sp. DT81.3 TaxID=3416523 RepID=UPI003CEF9F8E